jgi:ferredoxin--NADP+ reductase
VETILANLAAAGAAMAAPGGGGGGRAPVAELLDGRGVGYVDYEAWQCIDREETRRGEESGRPRVKLCLIDEMLAAVAAARQPVAD